MDKNCVDKRYKVEVQIIKKNIKSAGKLDIHQRKAQ
jgi:hypothetical protein